LRSAATAGEGRAATEKRRESWNQEGRKQTDKLSVVIKKEKSFFFSQEMHNST
jgi:hypothetical protein